ncbi:hypothetical protein [Nocardia carnea]|nr:hypothetical protein [Nocardia carnea]
MVAAGDVVPLHLAEQPDRRFDHRAHPGIQFGHGHDARALPGYGVSS